MKKKFVLLVVSCLIVLGIGTVVAQTETDWRDRVFYEIFVRSFYDSDGDGIGDLQGVIAKLDYLNDGDPATTTDLGITGIWLMPIMASPSYHGYDVTDYRTVNPDYGTNDDFRQLIDAAHARGIAVIIDLPVNHSSDQHPWFVASAGGDAEYADWYRWSNETSSGGTLQRVWHPLDGRYYYGIFDVHMPDLNHENPAVTTEMVDIARFWLEEMDVDGFRLDGLKHVIEESRLTENSPANIAWAEAFRESIRAIDPQALVVGEVWSDSTVASMYVPQAADVVFEFDLALAMIRAAKFGSASLVAAQQEDVLDLYPANGYATFLTNHDQNRTMVELEGDGDAAKVAANLLFTLPGLPFVYYGEEIGMVGSKPDERIRTPMQWSSEARASFTTGTPWQPLQDNYLITNVAPQTDDPDSLLSHYRRLIHLRSDHPALSHGDFTVIESASRKVYSFVRQSEEETVLVILNLSNDPVDTYALSLDESLAGTSATPLLGADVIEPELGAGYQPTAELAPFELLVLQIGG